MMDLDAYGTVLVSRTNVTNHRTAYIRKFVIWQYIHAQWKNVVFHAYGVSLSTLVGQSNTYVRNMLRRNPPEVRVTSGQQLCTEIIYIVLQTSVQLFWISSQKKSFLTTPNVENKFWNSYETLESTGEMRLMMKFYLCLHSFSKL